MYKKKIFIATGLYPPESGGPATYTKLLEELLPARGFEVSVLPFRTVRHLPPGIRHLAYFFMCVGYAAAADVVYAQDTFSVGLPAALAAKVAGKKFLVRVPGDYAWEQGRQRFGVVEELDEFQTKTYGWRLELLRTMQRFAVRRAVIVVAPSAYLAGIVAGWGIPQSRIATIYNGIALPVPAEPPQQQPKGFLVVSVGRRVPWKGFEALERVVARESRPEGGWQLYIAENLPRAQALGWVAAADAFVLNSTYEGLSHALLEAMSLGVPIIATSVGGNPELITDGVEGILIPPRDEQALHVALKRIEADPAAARARGAAAAARAKEFTIEKTLDKLCQLLNKI